MAEHLQVTPRLLIIGVLIWISLCCTLWSFFNYGNTNKIFVGCFMYISIGILLIIALYMVERR
jgi:ABC-type nitrate/sulfonate/bicarbonate transport system permease component